MKPSTAKFALAIATGAVSALGELAVQLSSGQLVNAPRVVVIGVGMTALVRIMGAGLQYLVERAVVAEATAAATAPDATEPRERGQ